MTATAQDEPEYTITVYRDHPDWAKTGGRWFALRSSLLNELHVATYDVPCHPEDGLPLNMKGCAKWVEKAHPGCILVYMDI